MLKELNFPLHFSPFLNLLFGSSLQKTHLLPLATKGTFVFI